MKIAFLGGGNMAGALIGGLLAKGYPAADLSVVEVVPQARENLVARYKVHVSEAADAVTLAADTLVLAVKPQDMKQAVAPLAGRLGRALVISIAAGIRLEDLSRWLGGHSRLVRVMPNTPALVGEGMAGLFARAEVSAEEKKRAESILGAVGKTVWVDDEALIDPVTAVSGSGPAYVFYFIEALEKTGVFRDVLSRSDSSVEDGGALMSVLQAYYNAPAPAAAPPAAIPPPAASEPGKDAPANRSAAHVAEGGRP